MTTLRTAAAVAAAIAALGLTAAAANPTVENAIHARQAQMDLHAFNLGILGAMAQGKAPYDAATAQAAADNLVLLSGLSATLHWLPGSDNATAADTRALPAIWANLADFAAKYAAFGDGARAMQAAAGGGLDAVKAAMGGLGGACGACHQTYRAPE
ncbi:MAG: cytochrome c [Rhodobacteraceae bacterium]|nr:cytochrome c [Paracoccaceae bacterium]